MAALTLSAIAKSYGGAAFSADAVSIDIWDGAVIVLVGPSGCGKSSLLRMVAGLATITPGRVQIAGRLVNAVNPADRDIAMTFQNDALYPHMTLRETMAYAPKNCRVAKAAIVSRLDEAAHGDQRRSPRWNAVCAGDGAGLCPAWR